MTGRTRGAAVVGVLALCCLALIAGWWLRARCIPDGWGTAAPYAGWCYTDVYPLWFAEALDVGAVPYLDHPVEYPVLTGGQMWAAAVLARVLPGDDASRFFDVTVAGSGALMLGVVGLLAATGVPVRRLVWIAAAPTLVIAAAINWDAAAVALLVGAIVLHTRGHDGWAGAAAGLGVAAKLFPGLLVPVVVTARLAAGQRRDAALHVAAAAAAWLAVNLPVLAAAPAGWWEFFRLSRARPPDWDSLWLVAERFSGLELGVPAVNAASAVLFLMGAVAIAAVGMRGRLAGEPDRWWVLIVPVLAWFLLTNKVYSPQFSLWLLPLLPLALPRVWPFVAFAVADLAVFAVRFPFLSGQAGFEEVLGYEWLGAAVLVRAVALIWIIVACVRPIADDATPSLEPVRQLR
jgi:uncharacterized membrane protein